MRRPEVGLSDVELTPAGSVDPMLAGLGPRVETFQWHGAEVVEVPRATDILARNDACGVQAMRVGRHAYGFQFHCEITAATVPEWKDIPAYRASLEHALGSDGANDLERDLASRLHDFEETARRLNANFMNIIETS